MSVYQVNLWICNHCGTTQATSEKGSSYDDPIVDPPKDWATGQEPPLEVRKYPEDDYWDLCPACVALGVVPNGFRDNTANDCREYYVDGRLNTSLSREALAQLPETYFHSLRPEWRAPWGEHPDVKRRGDER